MKRYERFRREVLNLPNMITIGRLFLIPPVLLWMDIADPFLCVMSSLVFMLAAVLDIIDGWLARRAGLCDLRWWRDVAERSVRSDMEAIAAIGPDLVVGDLRMSLATSARAARVPYVAVTNAAWTSRFAEEIQVPEGHLSERLLGRRVAKALFPTVKRILLWYWARGFDGVRKRLALPPLGSL